MPHSTWGSQVSSTEIRVAGMDCESCAVAIEAALRRLDGVEGVEVDLQTGLTRVVHGDHQIGKGILEQRIEELGFRVLRDGDQSTSVIQRAAISPFVLLVGFLIVTPLLFVFRNELAYMPGQNALFVPDELNLDTFGTVSAIAVLVAFITGVAVFFSPAILAMVSVVLGYTAGAMERGRTETVRIAAGFAIGLILVDAAVGAAYGAVGSAAISFLAGRLAISNLLIAILLAAVGLLMLRVWHLHLPGWNPRPRQAQSFRGALLLSAPFGLIDCPGCTPLLFPIAVGVAAIGDPVFGAVALGAYDLGRGVLLMTVGLSASLFKQLRGAPILLPFMEKIGGWLLLLAGLYFFKEFLRLADFIGS